MSRRQPPSKSRSGRRWRECGKHRSLAMDRFLMVARAFRTPLRRVFCAGRGTAGEVKPIARLAWASQSRRGPSALTARVVLRSEGGGESRVPYTATVCAAPDRSRPLRRSLPEPTPPARWRAVPRSRIVTALRRSMLAGRLCSMSLSGCSHSKRSRG